MSDPGESIEIQQVERFKADNGTSYYDVHYTNPQNGKPHAHRIPAEAVGTRMELLALTRAETLELLINEAHAPSDDVNAMYQTAIRTKRDALAKAARESRAQRLPWRSRLDAESAAFSDTGTDRHRIEHLRKFRRVLDGPGWNEAASWLEADREEIDMHAAWYIASHLVMIETQENRE